MMKTDKYVEGFQNINAEQLYLTISQNTPIKN